MTDVVIEAQKNVVVLSLGAVTELVALLGAAETCFKDEAEKNLGITKALCLNYAENAEFYRKQLVFFHNSALGLAKHG